MQLKEIKGTVERVGISGERKFKVLNNAKAFRALSDNIYSDKIGSIVRELSSNAYDSHVVAGTSHLPFDVYAPSRLSPNFIIRDYGIGLSQDDIFGLYTTYFESTKEHSNDVIGCWGIGSKSPFAYTDAILITSYFDGVETTYSAFLNEDREPCAVELHSQDSDEPSGLRVEVPVNANDCSKFCEKIAANYRYYKVKPNVSGVQLKEPPIDNGKDSLIFEGKLNDIEYRAAHQSGQFNVHTLIVGNVEYPLDIEEESEELNHNYSLTLFAPIGSVDVTLSREKISYSPRTTTFIRESLKGIAADIQRQIIEKIDECDCLYDAFQISYKYYGIFYKYLPYKGQDVKPFKIISTKDLDRKKVKLGWIRKNRNDNLMIQYLADSAETFHPTSSSNAEHFIINDNVKFLAPRLKENFKACSFVIIPDDIKIQGQINELYGILDRHWVRASSLSFTKPPPKPKTSGPKVDRNYVFSYNPNAWRATGSWIKHDSISNVKNNKAYYIELKNYNCGYTFDRFKNIYNSLLALDSSLIVYGIRSKKTLELAKNISGWEPLSTLINKSKDNIIEISAIKSAISNDALPFLESIRHKDTFIDKLCNALTNENIDRYVGRTLDYSKWSDIMRKTNEEIERLQKQWPIIELLYHNWDEKFLPLFLENIK